MKKIILLIFCLSYLFSACLKPVSTKPDSLIELTLDTLRLTVGTSVNLISKNYTSTDLLWKSSDSTVSLVSSTGLITAKKSGQSIITVTNKTATVSATCVVLVSSSGTINFIQIAGKGSDIGIGADSSVFVVGNENVSTTGGFSISKLVGNILVKLPDCAAIRVAVSPDGVPWVVNKSNLILRYNGTTWDQLPGTGTDIGIGADGSVFVVGTLNVSPTGGYNIMKWNGTDWTTLQDCAGIHISVSPQGIPWVVNKSNIVYKNTGGVLWEPIQGVLANDIGIGADGSVYVTGKDSTLVSYKPPIYKFNNGAWNTIAGVSGTSIAVSPKGFQWWIDKSNNIFRQVH